MSEELNDTVFTIINDQGEKVECEVLFTFDSDETKNSYIVYTDNTTDESGSTKVYASIYDPTGTNLALSPVESDEEWKVIENILASIQEKVQEADEANATSSAE